MSTTIELSDCRSVRAVTRVAMAPLSKTRTLPKRTGSMRFMGMSATPASSEANRAWNAASSAVMSIIFVPATSSPGSSKAAIASLGCGKTTCRVR
jgi:hypothetical protein